MLILLPGGAAASSREASATFTAPCVVGPGLLNVKTTMSISIHASGPEIVALGGELTLGSETVTINTPRELANTFSFLGSTSVRGSIRTLA